MVLDATFWQGLSSVLLSIGTGLQAGLALAQRGNARALNDWRGVLALQNEDDGRAVRDLVRQTPDLARSVNHATNQTVAWVVLSAGAAAAAPTPCVGGLAILFAAVTGALGWIGERNPNAATDESAEEK